jgi:stalled ribosome alternative rescue factor ArfA
MEVSALRENIWKPVVDQALHQLRVEQGRRGGGGAKKTIAHRE